MSSLVAQHPWASLLAAFLFGLLVEWVLELFFLRSRQFDLERRLNERERDYTELRHEHGRTLTDLKNRLTELDATQKAKLLAENQVAARDRELAELRQQVATQASSVAAAQAQQASDAARLEQALAEGRAAATRVEELTHEVAARESVHAALEAAVRNRDTTVSDLQNRLQSLEAERKAVAEALARVDADLGALRSKADEAGSLAADLRLARDSREAAEAARAERERECTRLAREVRRLETLLETARKEGEGTREELIDRAVAAEGRVAKAEARTGELETDLARLRGDWESVATALEKSRAAEASLRERVVELEERLEAAPAALPVVAATPAPASPDPELTERISALEAELAAVSGSHARLEEELRASREETDGLRGRLESAARTGASSPELEAVLADLDAVSRERNDLAAQLAALRSASPPSSTPARRSRTKPRAAELPGLLEELDSTSAPAEAPPKEFVAACPQHLSEVQGIGSAYETRLYAAGIGSYWQLSQMSDEALAEALELEDGQREQFDFSAVKAEALRLARETRSEGRRWNQEPPDDLEPIEGIGKALEKRLYDAGICTYDAIARMTPAELAAVCPSPTLKEDDYAHWIGQAVRLAAAKES